jgi:hypothetical protein
MSKDRKAESHAREVDGEEVFETATGISPAALRDLEACPFVDELTRLGHDPAAVLEAEHRVELARRNNDPAAVLEAEYLAELARLNHRWATAIPAERIVGPIQA